MTAIQNVTVVGASGTLGKRVVEALVAAGFRVTALSRASSTATWTPPAGVAVKKVDYGSPEALRAALAGQDALVSCVTTAAAGQQRPFLDAAFAAGVRRVLPAEFGVNTRTLTHPGMRTILQAKIETLDYLMAKSQERPDFTWTAISNSFFLDLGLKIGGLGLDLANRKATVVDSGDEPIDVTSEAFVARAVAAVLAAPERTANRYLAVAGAVTTQNRLRALAEAETGAAFAVERVNAAELWRRGDAKLAAGDYMAFRDFLRAHLFADGAAAAARDKANDLLGLGEEDPRDVLRAVLQGLEA